MKHQLILKALFMVLDMVNNSAGKQIILKNVR